MSSLITPTVINIQPLAHILDACSFILSSRALFTVYPNGIIQPHRTPLLVITTSPREGGQKEHRAQQKGCVKLIQLHMHPAGARCTKVLAVTVAKGERIHHDGCSRKFICTTLLSKGILCRMLKVVQLIFIFIIKISLASSSRKKCFQNCLRLQKFSEALAVQKLAGKRGINCCSILLAAIKTILPFTFLH